MSALRKPAYGSPCNGCGACCAAVVCPVGRAVLGIRREDRIQRCPALEPRDEGEGFGCGLVQHPARYAPALAKRCGELALSRAARTIIGSGTGCDAPTPEEYAAPDYLAKRTEIDETVRARSPASRAAAAGMWGILL